MEQLKNYTERHRRKSIRFENGRPYVERTDQWERLSREGDTEGGVESGNFASVTTFCDSCSGELTLSDRIELKGLVLHRKCARPFAEEILFQCVDRPGSIDADTELRARMLLKQSRQERWRQFRISLGRIFHRGATNGQR